MRLTRVVLFFVALIMGLGFYRLVDYLLEDLEFQTFQATEESMVDSAQLLAALVEVKWDDPIALETVFTDAKKRRFEARIFQKIKTKIGLDAYLTDNRGIVLFDSGDSKNIGKDFLKWRDVKKTLRGEYGTRSTRADENDPDSSVMFIGAPIFQKGEIVGCLSVYKSQQDVIPFVKARRQQIIQSVVLIGLGILALITAVFVWLFRPIGQLTAYARSIARGERRSKPNVGVGREVNTLANALHDMRKSLEGREHADQYIQNLTHELKSPLAAIQGAAELLNEDMPSKDRAHFLENIQNQTARCERLTHRLLELSAVEALSHLEVSHEFDFVARCNQSIEQLKPLAETHQVQLVATHPNRQPYRGNELLMGSAINHLLENAVQFSSENAEVALTLTTTAKELIISVRDHGPGIPDFASERAFERFYSYRPELQNSNKGNGLGLAFVKEVTELHHGTAEIATHPEGGTEARLRFPIPAKLYT
ncbi:MAG: two-component system sensor histidine kinase CreC [Akkermansiaceae bacterium]|jgi:two-component system sensor histidine kinase CreC|tara:strand:- start:39 stop:1478 length:1440 start_codon:yes stop_codon:yes gene_type:complete